MKETRKDIWLIPGEICIAKGNSAARNLMFECKKDHQLFLNLWDKYLGDMTEVLNYHLSPDTWTILFKVKSSSEITTAYHNQRRKSRKAKRRNILIEPKRMISEHIRIFLSQYVRNLNRKSGRKGSLVMERFRKYIIKKQADYERIFKLLTNQVRFKTQERDKYRANETHYDRDKELSKNSVWRVGSAFYDGILECKSVLRCMRLLKPSSSVLRKFYSNRNQATNTS